MSLLLTGAGTPAVAASGGSIKTGLVSFWEMEEASGVRDDAHGAFNLDFYNTITRVTGRNGTAFAVSVGVSSNLNYAGAMSAWTSGMSIVVWVRFPTTVPSSGIISCGTKAGAPGNKEFALSYQGGLARFYFEVIDVADNKYFILSTEANTPVADTWYMVTGTADNSNVKISVHGPSMSGSQHSATQSTAITPTGNYYLIFGDNATVTYYDQVGLWERPLTTTEISFLYNSGAGRNYSEL